MNIQVQMKHYSLQEGAAECMRCFREGIGMPPVQYLKNYRLLMASTYLKTTDWPVGEIGRRGAFGKWAALGSSSKTSSASPYAIPETEGTVTMTADNDEKFLQEPCFLQEFITIRPQQSIQARKCPCWT